MHKIDKTRGPFWNVRHTDSPATLTATNSFVKNTVRKTGNQGWAAEHSKNMNLKTPSEDKGRE